MMSRDNCPKNTGNKLRPHSELEQEAELYSLRSHHKSGQPFVSGEVVQDDTNRLYLLINANYGALLKKTVTKDLEGGYKHSTLENWLVLMEKYSIGTLIGDGYIGSMASTVERTKEPKTIISLDLLGELRKDYYLLDFAQRYKMTYTQYCRFRALTRSCQDAEISVNCEKIAQEITEGEK